MVGNAGPWWSLKPESPPSVSIHQAHLHLRKWHERKGISTGSYQGRRSRQEPKKMDVCRELVLLQILLPGRKSELERGENDSVNMANT